MTENTNNLRRPVSYKIFKSMGESEVKEGHFHLWRKSVSEDGEEHFYALVEESDGKMRHVQALDIRFLDK